MPGELAQHRAWPCGKEPLDFTLRVFGWRSVFLSVTTSGTGLDQVSASIRQGFQVSRMNSRKASEGVTETHDTTHGDSGPGNLLYLHLQDK